jgi:16S rRNA (adenine1518-N6/adenine1519-N6)-dimethyltransferase
MTDKPTPKKQLGQHWLTDTSSLQAVCDAANITPTDIILEIGPGLGNLTELLTLSAKKVFAVEFDEQLADELPSRITADNLEAISADIMQFDFRVLPKGYKVVANIPYYLTSNLLRLLCETPNPPVQMSLLVQKEVAERIAAEPGDMSLLSVSVQFYYQAELANVVSASMFTPPPKVDSQIIKLIRHPQPLFPDVDVRNFFRLVKAGFSNRRKTLLNSLSGGLNWDKTEVKGAIEKAGLDPEARAQTLSLDDWHSLYLATLVTQKAERAG